eukprot:1019567-Pelagomonas_calceolata.AAC.1
MKEERQGEQEVSGGLEAPLQDACLYDTHSAQMQDQAQINNAANVLARCSAAGGAQATYGIASPNARTSNDEQRWQTSDK